MTGHFSSWGVCLFILCCFFPTQGWSQVDFKSGEALRSKIYAENSRRQKWLFDLNRIVELDGSDTRIQTRFVTPEGKEVVFEETTVGDAEKNIQIKKYILKKFQIDESGTLETRDGKIYFSYTRQGKTETATESAPLNLITGSVTIRFIMNHWSEIMNGQEVDARYAALDRRETVGFKFFKVAEEKRDGKDVVIVKMKPKSLVIAAIVDPILFTFEKAPIRCLSVVGRTLPKRLEDSTWKDLDAEIIYSY